MPNTHRKTYRLANGLTLFAQERHAAPIASFWTWYRVGSRNEIPGLTGVSHWVEHMQFKGTPNRAKGSIFGDIQRIGGQLNAMTSADWTTYHETIPAEHLPLSIAIESDRMRNSLFDPDEVDSERTVILSERQGAENRPTYHLYEEVIGTAFPGHGYGHPVIGREADLRQMTRDDLYSHYQQYYRPDNAFITAVGDFDADELAQQVEHAFGSIENPSTALRPVATGSAQVAERRIILRRPSPAAYLMMGYKMPPANHPDVPAIMVADAILSGAKAMGMGGGSGNGRSSRLYQALVTSGLARSAGSNADPSKDESLWSFNATALPGTEPEAIEAALDEQIERLRESLPEAEELAKASKQIRAQYVYSLENVTGEAFWLGNMEILDSIDRVDTFADEFDAVTPQDVQRVAREYLVPQRRTIGWQLPDEDEVAAGADVELPTIESWQPRVFAFSDGAENPQGFERTVLDNGIVVLAQPRRGVESVDGTIRFNAGNAATGDPTPGLASTMAAMMNRGTGNRSFAEFNEEVDTLAAMVGASAGRSSVDIGWHALAEDQDAVLDIVADIARNPVFPDDELERMKPQMLTGIQERERNTSHMADRAVVDLLYPEGHPYRIESAGTRESIAAMTTDDLRAYHARHVGPNVATIAVTGGIESLERLTERLNRVLADWQVDVGQTEDHHPVDPRPHTVRSAKTVRGTSQANVEIAYPSIPRAHDDYYAMQLGNLILGQLGLMGRLGAEVRDKSGMAYYAGSSFRGGLANSMWVAGAGVDPANIDRALEGMVAELRKIREEPVSAEELSDARSYLIGTLPLGLESLGGVTDLLLTLERFNLGLDYISRYPDIVASITAEDILRSMQAHLDPDRLAIGIAGPGVAE